jgi:ubiquinone/menaquinone biosynthesis C-methylase UbiE
MTAPGRDGRDGREHYSYTHYASQSVAEGFDALRFSGDVGQFLLEQQAALLAAALAPLQGRRIADVGTGTGRAAIGLARLGAQVVGFDASAEMLGVARMRAAEAGVSIPFSVGDAHALPLPDRDVDAAVCLRVLMHAIDWERCLAELCRVSKWRVVFDFPSASSAAAIESAVRRARLKRGHKVEAYRVFSEQEITSALARQGFHVVDLRRQFVLPIAFHKAVGRFSVTRRIERGLERAGALRLFGSPVTVVAQR